MKKPIILIVNPRNCYDFTKFMHAHQVEIVKAPNPSKALDFLNKHNRVLLIAGGNSQQFKLFREITRQQPEFQPVLIYQNGDFTTPPVMVNSAAISKIEAPEYRRLIKELLGYFPSLQNGNSGPSSASFIGEERLVGKSAVIQMLRTRLPQIAAADCVVLITGETGTGKELAAKLIHQNSPRRKGPLVCVNCAALPETLLESELFGYERGAFTGATVQRPGKFELAGGGVLFLDEIGEMSLSAQSKVLRVLDSQEFFRLGGTKPVKFNARIITATNQNLEELVAAKKFRADLYYRLNVARLHLPPLHERREDIPLLLKHYIDYFNRQYNRNVKIFSEEVLSCLIQYDWPGNVRELRNLCEAIFINLPPQTIRLRDLPELYRKKMEKIATYSRCERDRLLSALFTTNWNVSQAATRLKWSRMTVYRKMEKYRIARPEGRNKEKLPV